MTVASQRNPAWAWDEEVLAFDLYLRHGKQLDDSHDEVVELSAFLRSLPLHATSLRTPTFRNPNGVARKLADIHTHAPSYQGGKTSGSRLDEEVWDRFAGATGEAHALAERIRRSALFLGGNGRPELDEEEVDAIHRQGILRYRSHRVAERDRALRSTLLDSSRAASRTGRASCEGCGLQLEALHGRVGAVVLDCHDLRPLSLEPLTAKSSDCVLLCPTCHALAHRATSWPVLSET